MSWHYSQALEEVFLEVDSWDGDRAALSRSILSGEISLCKDKTTGAWSRSQSGMMLETSTGDLYVDAFISSLAAFPASLSHKLDQEQENRIAAICGLTQLGLFKTFSLLTSSWKTSLSYLLIHTLERSCRIWPKAGIMCGMQLFQHPRLEPIISANVYGLQESLPTPLSGNWKSSYLPVPLQRDQKDSHRSGKRGGKEQRDTLPRAIGGPVNPEFSEWMMGFPIGWTALKPLEMHKFQEWLELHGSC